MEREERRRRGAGDGDASVLARIDPGGEMEPLWEEREMLQFRSEGAYGKRPPACASADDGTYHKMKIPIV